jgi:hypothetical protein
MASCAAWVVLMLAWLCAWAPPLAAARPEAPAFALGRAAQAPRATDRTDSVVSPLIQSAELSGGAESAGSNFGSSVALSADGETALVGGPSYDEGTGAVWVFTRSGSSWTQQGKKLTSGGAGGRFGTSVALSADGNTALIGEPYPHPGAAWVFTRSGSTWTRQGVKLTAGRENNVDAFGASVALSADGNTAMIGAPGYGGAAWVFTRSGSTWTQQGEELTSGESEPGAFGSGVALSADGNIALIGGKSYTLAFARSGSTWSQQDTLAGLGQDLGPFGAGELALSTDGDTALIGGIGGSLSEPGAAWVFTRSGPVWTQQGPELTGAGEISEGEGGGEFGASVALSASGDAALIGGPGDAASVGAVWAFVRSGETWTEQGSKLAGTGDGGTLDGSKFGASVALSADAGTALVGSPGENSGAGAAWVFANDGAPGVTTGSASSVSATSVALDGTVDPRGLPTTGYFEYGPTTAYGQSTSGQRIGAVESVTPVAADLSGLPPAATFHFRAVAESAAGTSYGEDQTFTTGASENPTAGSSPIPELMDPTIPPSTVQSTMSWRFAFTRRYTVVTSLIVSGVPTNGEVAVTCHGRGCPFAHDRAASVHRPGPEVRLTHLFKGRHLGVGARISVSVVEQGWVGKSFVFTTRSNRIPSVRIACLAPGASQPGRGC